MYWSLWGIKEEGGGDAMWLLKGFFLLFSSLLAMMGDEGWKGRFFFFF